MKTHIIVLLLMLCLTTILTAQATGLLISEYVEGTSYNKAIEIFNGTGVAVDLSNYSLKKQTNGNGAFGASGATLTLSGTLANNDVFVVVSSATGGTNLAGQAFVDLATTNQAINFNGNDAVALYHNDVQIDVVGIANQATPDWGANVTLVRNSTVASPTTAFTFDQWTSLSVDTFSNLGFHTFTGGSTDPIIIVSNPNSAITWYVGQTYTISWSSANLTGNVQIELNDNESYSTIADNIENTGAYSWTIPINQPLSSLCKIKISNMSATVWDMSDTFFTIAQPTNIPTIAQLRASTPGGSTVYCLTGEAILTYQQSFRQQKFIQDATAAILIDDLNSVITTPYNIGDGITGIIGTLGEYAGMLQFIPYANSAAATSTNNEIVPQIVTLNDLTTNFETYESELIKVVNCSFTNPSGNFANGTVYPISDASGTYTFRTNFYDVDYIGQPIPSTPKNIIGIPTSRLESNIVVNHFTARSIADFQTPTNQAAAPTFDPAAGLYNAPIQVSISTTTENAVIYYTLDGTEPTENSTEFTNPIPVDATLTIKAIAIATGMPASDVSVATYTIVVSNDDMIHDTTPITIITNYPNPFKGNTSISFKTRNAQPVAIEIFNLKGQLIRTMKSDAKSTGENTVIWNGLDENGRRVAAGMYLYNIKGGRFSSSKKMILLK